MSRFLSSRALKALGLVLVAAVVGGLAGQAGANHRFSDVPERSVFHDAITNIADAGCATGFPGGTFQPEEPVKRQQMARFLNTCSGRVDYGTGEAALALDDVSLATASITAGAIGEGQGFILATGSAHLQTSSSGAALPCEGTTVALEDGRSAREVTFVDLNDTGEQFEDSNVTLTFVVPVSAGETVDLSLNASKGTCGAAVNGRGWLTALYVPFRGDGTAGAPA